MGDVIKFPADAITGDDILERADEQIIIGVMPSGEMAIYADCDSAESIIEMLEDALLAMKEEFFHELSH